MITTTEPQTRLKTLEERLGDRAQSNAPLARYAWAGIGGPADLLITVHNRDELIEAVQLARKHHMPHRVFGGMTNVLLPDAGLRGLVILNHARNLRIEQPCRLYAESGAIVVKAAREALQHGWGGLTWAVGLPGTIGGAVINNAGAFGGKISRILTSAEILGPQGDIQQVGPEWFDFGYRYSRLKGANTPWIILSATFQLREREVEHLAKKAKAYTERRRGTQPPGKTLGSTFKNPPGDYAGRLIDAAGLKGTRRGGIVISRQHANFFVNEGHGTASDYVALTQHAQGEVRKRFGILLEPEIEIIVQEEDPEPLLG